MACDEFEGFGIVFLEAAACGKPVIGGSTGGTRDAVQDGVNGLLVDTEDIEALADAIRRFAGSEAEREEFGARGRAWVAGNFSWRKYAKQILAISRDVVARAR